MAMQRERGENRPNFLQALPEDVRRLWTDSSERRSALEAIVLAWELGDPNLQSLIQRVDDAVVQGLAAYGLPRGPVMAVRLQPGWTPWRGRKTSECEILLSGTHLRDLLREDSPDDVFRAWIHESLHARQPFALTAHQEYRDFRGYEEGLVEGLTRTICHEQAGLVPRDQPFPYYLAVYAGLANVLETTVEILWRSLWTCRAGEIRSQFVGVIERHRRLPGRSDLASWQVALLQLRADSMFDSRRLDYTIDDAAIERSWREILE